MTSGANGRWVVSGERFIDGAWHTFVQEIELPLTLGTVGGTYMGFQGAIVGPADPICTAKVRCAPDQPGNQGWSMRGTWKHFFNSTDWFEILDVGWVDNIGYVRIGDLAEWTWLPINWTQSANVAVSTTTLEITYP
jgi:hypothetical protein